MKLITGLGNYEPKYLLTRHNAGFIAVDLFAKRHNQEFKTEKKLKGMISKFRFNNEDIILLKPLTFMNLSGESIALTCNFYKIEPKDVFVIFDDISLDLGKIRLRASGSDGGHNGIKSVIKHLSTKDFDRLKIGIGPQPNIPSENFVLQNFTAQQLETLKDVLSQEIIEDYLTSGLQKCQNKYN